MTAIGVLGAHAPRGLDAVDAGHPLIDDDHVGVLGSRASSTAVSPSADSADDLEPGVIPTSARAASRKTGWSSTVSTRTMAITFHRPRPAAMGRASPAEGCAHACPPAGGGDHPFRVMRRAASLRRWAGGTRIVA